MRTILSFFLLFRLSTKVYCLCYEAPDVDVDIEEPSSFLPFLVADEASECGFYYACEACYVETLVLSSLCEVSTLDSEAVEGNFTDG